MILRPYQREALDAIINGPLTAFCQLPTGTGKSLVQTLLAKWATDQGLSVAYVVNYNHLVTNALKNLRYHYTDEQIGIVKAERNEVGCPVTICSIQTLLDDDRLDAVRERFDLVMVDEGHLFLSDRFGEVTATLRKAGGRLVGFSATIKRLDGRPLSDLFGELVFTRPLWQMIEEGWLCNLKGVKLNAEIDFTQARQQGEFTDQELAPLLETAEAMGHIYRGWKHYAADRVTMIFLPSVRAAHEYAVYFRERGELAVAIDGTMNQAERDRILEDFTEGRIQVLLNCQLLTVGFDHPPISCLVMARPTRSQTLAIQMTGRGTRVCSPEMYAACTQPIKDRVQKRKDDCLVLDIGGVSDLGLVQFPMLFDLPGNETRQIERVYQNDTPVDFHEIMQQHKTLYQARAIIAERVDIVNESRFVWIKTAFGWIAEAGAGRVRLVKEGRREFYVESQVQSETGWVTERLYPYPLELDWAMPIAEEWVTGVVAQNPNEARIAERDARWRGDVLTGKQFLVLKRAYRKRFQEWETYEEYLESDDPITKGAASELIGAKFAERDRRRELRHPRNPANRP